MSLTSYWGQQRMSLTFYPRNFNRLSKCSLLYHVFTSITSISFFFFFCIRLVWKSLLGILDHVTLSSVGCVWFVHNFNNYLRLYTGFPHFLDNAYGFSTLISEFLNLWRSCSGQVHTRCKHTHRCLPIFMFTGLVASDGECHAHKHIG